MNTATRTPAANAFATWTVSDLVSQLAHHEMTHGHTMADRERAHEQRIALSRKVGGAARAVAAVTAEVSARREERRAGRREGV